MALPIVQAVSAGIRIVQIETGRLNRWIQFCSSFYRPTCVFTGIQLVALSSYTHTAQSWPHLPLMHLILDLNEMHCIPHIYDGTCSHTQIQAYSANNNKNEAKIDKNNTQMKDLDNFLSLASTWLVAAVYFLLISIVSRLIWQTIVYPWDYFHCAYRNGGYNFTDEFRNVRVMRRGGNGVVNWNPKPNWERRSNLKFVLRTSGNRAEILCST